MHENRLNELEEWVWSIWGIRDIENSEFNIIKEELDEIYSETNDYKCLWILSEMYKLKSIWARKKVAEISKKGLEQISSHGGFHDNFSVSSDGPEFDFKKRNHNKIITFYKNYIEDKPDDLISRRILIENLIDNYRFEEADKEIEKAYSVANNKIYYLEFLKGEILYKSGNQDKAIALWKSTIEKNEDSYTCTFLLAERFATYANYDEALKYYQLAFDKQSKPRRIDVLETMVQLYEIKEEKENMLKTLNLIIEVYKDDYNMLDGEATEFYIYRDKLLLELSK